MVGRSTYVIFAAIGGLYTFQGSALALPTMIRLGYPTCASCHVAPQGGGLLNLYGRGIDQAQSLVGGEHSPSEASVFKFLNAEGRINQDIRVVMQQQDSSTTDRPGQQIVRSRFMYRNATELGKGFRVTITATGKNESAARPLLAYDAPVKPAQLFVNTALLSYRANPSLVLLCHNVLSRLSLLLGSCMLNR